jgi:hypothetical protein
MPLRRYITGPSSTLTRARWPHLLLLLLVPNTTA